MGDGVAHLHLLRGLDARNDVAHIACRELVAWREVEFQDTNFVGMILFFGVDEFHKIVLADSAVHNLEVGNDAAEWIEHRVENQRLQRCIGVARRCRHALNNGIEHILYAKTGLAACAQHALGLAAQEVHYLVLHLVGVGAVEVHLVQHRNNLQAMVDCHIQVGDGLRLNTLRSINNQQRALACRNRARHLVGEVDVSRGVNQVESILLAFIVILHLNGMALDGDATLALKVHVVEHLCLQVLCLYGVGIFKQTVGKRALSVVDMRYNAKIPYIFHSKKVYYLPIIIYTLCSWATALSRRIHIARATNAHSAPISCKFSKKCANHKPSAIVYFGALMQCGNFLWENCEDKEFF